MLEYKTQDMKLSRLGSSTTAPPSSSCTFASNFLGLAGSLGDGFILVLPFD